MPARLLDGKAHAKTVRARVAERARRLAAEHRAPGLVVVLVGEDPASRVYVRNKDKAATKAGFEVRTIERSATTSQAELLGLIDELNADPTVDGILVQLPLPPGLDAGEVVARLDPAKDVDGLGPANVAALWAGQEGLRPCTPLGCLELLDHAEVEPAGKRAVVLGRSMLVGKPVAALLLERNATVTLAHSRTRNLRELCQEAEILVAAVGRPGLVQGDWVREGAVVLDVGINRGADGKLTGDVDFEPARERAAAITPVPGGVGPMTIAMLLSNTVTAAERRLAGEVTRSWLTPSVEEPGAWRSRR